MSVTQKARIVYLLAIVAAIGCGTKPQEAAATNDAAKTDRPIQLAAAMDAGAAPAASGSSTVSGSIKLNGAAPAAERIKMDADPQCQLQHAEPVNKRDVVVNGNGTLKNVFVYVKEGLQGKTFASPTQSAKMDQHGCMYEPHVLGVQVNQPIEILNSDSTLHNVNCKATKSKAFNIAQPTQGMKSTKSFAAPEIMVKCACNVHPWMSMYIGVTDHPFFGVSDDQGAFSLSGLPAGTYTLEAWHEKYGTQTQQVTVGEGESKSVDFAFTTQ